MAKAAQFRELRVKDLKMAKYNPASRTHSPAMRQLVRSIGEYGLLYPILVTDKNEVIDGHRRIAAYEELGLETIPAIVGVGNRNELYASVNATAKRMTGSESLQVFLSEPMAVIPILRARFQNMVDVLGMPRVNRLVKSGCSVRTFDRASQVVTYCNLEPTWIPKMFDWLLRTQSVHSLNEAMRSGVSPKTIITACKKNVSIRFKAVMS